MAETPIRRIQTTLGHLVVPHPLHLSLLQSQETQQQQFRFTVDNNILTLEQRKFYEDNGFLVVKGLIDKNELEVYRQRFSDLAEGRIPKPPSLVIMRDIAFIKSNRNSNALGEAGINKIQTFQDDPVLFRYCQNPKLLDYASCFIGPNIKTIHTMLINKPPNVGKTGRHPLHQDLYYLPLRPAEKIVGSWTAIDRVSRENGCLVVIPQTHNGPLLDHAYPDWEAEGGVNRAYYGVRGMGAQTERVYLEMEVGDTVFFNPVLIHGSGANKTNGFRKAISCHFASSDCYFIDAKETKQEEVGEEMSAMNEQTSGLKLSFNDLWRNRSRLVRGREGTF